MATRNLAAKLFTVGDGSRYASISSALLDMRDGDVCIIKQGIYRERINVPQNKVTLRGEGRVVVTGCDVFENPAPAEINGHDCLVFDVGKPIYETFCGQQHLPQARVPNKTKPMTSNEDWVLSDMSSKGLVRLSEESVTVLRNLDDGYFVGVGRLNSWYSISIPIKGTDQNGGILVDSANASSGYMGGHGKGRTMGYVIGAKAALDSPGEWYSNGKQVWVIPPTTVDGGYEFRSRLLQVRQFCLWQLWRFEEARC